MKYPNFFVENLHVVKNQIDKGENFQKEIKEAQKIIDDPELTFQKCEAAGEAVASMYQWVITIIQYYKHKRLQIDSSKKPALNTSPTPKEQWDQDLKA